MAVYNASDGDNEVGRHELGPHVIEPNLAGAIAIADHW